MRIALLSDPELVNCNYRAFQPLSAVARRGAHELVRNGRGRPLSEHELLRCDAVHIHRIATAEVRAVARKLRAAGVGIVWDNDDDVAALPRSNPLYRRKGAAGRRQMIAGTAEMVRLAHVVTTPSAVLATKFRGQGACDVRVLENRLPRHFMNVKPVRHEGVTIACLAGLEHRVDYERLRLRDTFARLLAVHPGLHVLSIGLGLGLPSERYEHRPAVPFLDLVRNLSQADIGIAPLVDIPWNRARSNVKLKEYAAAGLAWLASPIGPYVGMGERQGGVLVGDDAWPDELERLIADARARRRLAKRGAQWVKGEHVDKHAAEWERALTDATVRARDEIAER